MSAKEKYTMRLSRHRTYVNPLPVLAASLKPYRSSSFLLLVQSFWYMLFLPMRMVTSTIA